MNTKSFLNSANLPAGLRNNNPGNLVIGSSWLGLVGNDGKFCQFSNVEFGLRALALDIINNINKGVDTLTTFITKYAPAADNNNPQDYIDYVVLTAGNGADEILGTDINTISSIMQSICEMENGQLICDANLEQQDYFDGYNLAMNTSEGLKEYVSEIISNPIEFWKPLFFIGIIIIFISKQLKN